MLENLLLSIVSPQLRAPQWNSPPRIDFCFWNLGSMSSGPMELSAAGIALDMILRSFLIQISIVCQLLFLTVWETLLVRGRRSASKKMAITFNRPFSVHCIFLRFFLHLRQEYFV